MLRRVFAAPAPPPLSAQVIGRSVQRRPIRVVTSGDADAKVKVLIVGCIHGTEPAGMAVTKALRRVRPPAGARWLIMDTINPDACRRSGSRGNAHGVDLNRNFPWGWRRQGGLFASGSRSGSEPETRAAMALIDRERPRVTIWFHQHMDLIDDTRGSDPAVIKAYALASGLRARRLAPLPGTATRWQNHKHSGTTSFVVELPAGPMSGAAVRRHIGAVVAVARIA